MRILYFSYVNLDRPNACQTHTLGLLRGFSHHGCRVDALVPQPQGAAPPMLEVHYHFTGPYQGGKRRLLRHLAVSAALMFNLCRRNAYQAIYARDMDVFVGPRLCARFFRIPLFLEIDDTPVEGDYPPFIRKLVALNVKQDYRQAAGLIVPSVPRCRILAEQYGVPPHKVHLILNGTELLPSPAAPAAAAQRRLGLPPDSFCLGYVGTINDRYDFATLLTAMAQLLREIPRLFLIMVGDGPGLAQVKRLVQDSGLQERVRFTGFIPQEQFGAILPALDLGLMTLTTQAVLVHGPIHTKLGTYAMYRIPIITAGFSLDGYPEEVHQGVFLVPPEDPQALAAMIQRLYQHPRRRQTVADTLHRYVQEKLTWNAVAQDILEIMGA